MPEKQMGVKLLLQKKQTVLPGNCAQLLSIQTLAVLELCRLFSVNSVKFSADHKVEEKSLQRRKLVWAVWALASMSARRWRSSGGRYKFLF